MAKSAKKLILFEVSHSIDESLKSIAIIQGRSVSVVIAILAECVLDAVAKEPRVLIRFREYRGEKPTCFEDVGLTGKHFRLSMQLASACGLTVSEFFCRLLAVGIEFCPKSGSWNKEEIISAIRADCVIRFSRLA
jgi:hypothetical protein